MIRSLAADEAPPLGTTDPYASRTLIIINPTAGQDDPVRLRRRIGGAFAAREAAFDLVTTERPEHATELARAAANRGYRSVCVVGGDGTIAEAVAGLADTTTPLAIIPRGTANQVARNLLIPNELEAAVEVAVSGVETHLDLGRINGRAFALVAGAGIDAAIMASATRDMKDRWGFGAYVFAAVKEALSAEPTLFRITADGQQLEVRAVSVMLGNMGELFAQFIPFPIPLTPEADTLSWQDGMLEVVILAPHGLPDLATVLWKAARRKFGGDDQLIHFRAREIRIEADPPIQVQIDGDPFGRTPIEASVGGGIRVLTPRTHT